MASDRGGRREPKAKKAVVAPVFQDSDIVGMFHKGRPCANYRYTVQKGPNASVDLIRNNDGLRLARVGRLNDKKCCWITLDHDDLAFLMAVARPFADYGQLFTSEYQLIHFRHFQEEYNKQMERKLGESGKTLF